MAWVAALWEGAISCQGSRDVVAYAHHSETLALLYVYPPMHEASDMFVVISMDARIVMKKSLAMLLAGSSLFCVMSLHQFPYIKLRILINQLTFS